MLFYNGCNVKSKKKRFRICCILEKFYNVLSFEEMKMAIGAIKMHMCYML